MEFNDIQWLFLFAHAYIYDFFCRVPVSRSKYLSMDGCKSSFFLFLCILREICLKISIPKLLKKPGLVWMLIIIIVLMHNYDLKESITARQPICYISLFILFFILSQTITWVKFFWGVVKIFCTFHLITGIFFLFNKSMLINNIIPLFQVDENVIRLLYQAIENGYMTGLCYHYSTMGMYMALGVVAFSDMLLLQKSTWIQKLEFFRCFRTVTHR